MPRRKAWQPTPVFLPGESHGQRILAGYSPWGGKESDVTEQPTHTKIWKLRTRREEWLVPGSHRDEPRLWALSSWPWDSGSEITVFSVTPLPRGWGGVSIIQDARDYVGMCKENTRTYIPACYLFTINFYWSIVASQCCVRSYGTAKWISCVWAGISSLDFLPV